VLLAEEMDESLNKLNIVTSQHLECSCVLHWLVPETPIGLHCFEALRCIPQSLKFEVHL
jgi:hypothetical protein